VQALRDAGFNDEGVVEIVAHVALNLFTNYVNVALAVPVDFPAVKLSSGA
jgi:alkylhydroperoxidase family enzyme